MCAKDTRPFQVFEFLQKDKSLDLPKAAEEDRRLQEHSRIVHKELQKKPGGFVSQIRDPYPFP